MLDPTLLDRFQKLVEARISERRKQFPIELSQINSQAAARGMFHSSVLLLQTHQAHERELEIRAILAWESLVRVHRTFGCPMSDQLRDDLKTEINRQIEQSFEELGRSFVERIQETKVKEELSLDDARHAVIAKHEIEIDLYADSLSIAPAQQSAYPMAYNYNFYGNIGSVQTGVNAIANVVQHLGADDRASLAAALQQVKEAIGVAPSFAEQQRRELLEIAEECSFQIGTESPNNTKLLTMFNTLGTAIQSIASAQPAYQALKIAVLPLGITLP